MARDQVLVQRPRSAAKEQAVRTLLEGIGEDPDREGLADTPARFVKTFHELTAGVAQDPAEILARVFDEPYDGPVSVQGIPYWSLCEHHLLPFSGTVDVTYVPDGKVVGLSKISRLVQCFARCLQMQERMTRQIADAIEEHLHAAGVQVVVRGQHSCMAARGIQTPATMETRVERGCLQGGTATPHVPRGERGPTRHVPGGGPEHPVPHGLPVCAPCPRREAS